MVRFCLFRQEELHHLEKDILSPILNVEGVEEWVSIFKITDARHVVFQLLRLDHMDGQQKLNKEEVKELEEWDTLKLSPESTRTSSRTRLSDSYLNHNQHFSHTPPSTHHQPPRNRQHNRFRIELNCADHTRHI